MGLNGIFSGSCVLRALYGYIDFLGNITWGCWGLFDVNRSGTKLDVCRNEHWIILHKCKNSENLERLILLYSQETDKR